MHLVKYVASEPIAAQEELELGNSLTYAEAQEYAQKELKRMYPDLNDIDVIGIEEV